MKIKMDNVICYSILLLIIGLCALRSISIVMYIVQIIFLFLMALNIMKKKKIKINGYICTYVLYAIFALSSVIWAQSSKNFISAYKPLIQLVVICVLLCDYVDTKSKIQFVFNCVLISSIVLALFLFIKTPASAWRDSLKVSTNASSSANRIGPSIGFQPNWFGIICAFSIVLWIYYLTIEKKHKKIAIIMIIVLCILVIFTKSRKAIIISVIGPIMYWLLYKPRKKELMILIPISILFIVGLLWAIFNNAFLYKMIGFRLIGIFGMFSDRVTADASVLTREDMVKIGWNLFLSHPIKGVGFGNFAYYYYNYYSGWAETYAHNNYIEILADTGAIGFILYYIVPFYMICCLIRNWRIFIDKDRKLSAFLLTFMLVRLIMDYGMVDYDDEFVQIITVNCYSAIQFLKGTSSRLKERSNIFYEKHGNE